jgi:hypothetical protein
MNLIPIIAHPTVIMSYGGRTSLCGESDTKRHNRARLVLSE